MENKQEKTAAEIYREERKQRMAKAAKKNSKKSPQLSKAGRTLGKCFIVVVIAAVCLAIVYGCLDFSGVLQRNLMTAMKVGKTRISVAEYNYYYMAMYTRLNSTANQYDNYYGAGSGKTYTGFDTSVAPDKQDYTGGEIEGVENPTWADYFDDSAKTQIQLYTAFSELGRAAGLTLTDEQKENIETTLNDYKTTAAKSDYSLGRFLVKNFGKGVTEKLVREFMEDQAIAQNYYDQQEKSINSGITDEQINEEFAANKKDYTTFGIAMFEVKANIPEAEEGASEDDIAAAKTLAMAEAKLQADNLLASANSVDSFVAAGTRYDSNLTADNIVTSDASSATVSSYVPDAVDWIFAAERVAGDKSVFEVDDGYYLLYLVSAPVADETKGVDVRHILVQFASSTDEQGNEVELTDEQKAEYKTKADEIYAEYLQNPTEDNFAELAGKYSEDPGSKDNGGLYEAVYPGEMVQQFNDWIFAAERKPGDTDIIETSYGYHIMYFVNNDNEPSWKNSIREHLSGDLTEKMTSDIVEGDDYKLDVKENNTKWAMKALNKYISTLISNSSR